MRNIILLGRLRIGVGAVKLKFLKALKLNIMFKKKCICLSIVTCIIVILTGQNNQNNNKYTYEQILESAPDGYIILKGIEGTGFILVNLNPYDVIPCIDSIKNYRINVRVRQQKESEIWKVEEFRIRINYNTENEISICSNENSNIEKLTSELIVFLNEALFLIYGYESIFPPLPLEHPLSDVASFNFDLPYPEEWCEKERLKNEQNISNI